MPHVDKPTRVALLETDRQVVKMGDACYLFAKDALERYNADPTWTTIHKIRVALRAPYHDEGTHGLIRSKMGHMSKVDIEAAADLAFLEFYRLVGAAHEDVKALENGNVFEGAKIPEVKRVVDNQARAESPKEPVSALQGAEEAGRGRRKRVDNQAV